MKYSSEHFIRRFICLSSIKVSSSFSTRSNRCSGTLLPLCCVGLKFSLNVDFAMWFFDLPSLVHRCGYFLNIHLFIFCSMVVSEIKPTVLPIGLDALKWTPSLRRMSLPKTFCGRLLTSKILQFVAFHEPELSVMFRTPFIWISWLLKHFYFVFSVNFDILAS